MNFGQAIEEMKSGNAVARKGWNGKNMFIYLNKGSNDFDKNEDIPKLIEGIGSYLFQKGDSGTFRRLPNINMYTATGSTLTGWLASQTDILAEDWESVVLPERCDK